LRGGITQNNLLDEAETRSWKGEMMGRLLADVFFGRFFGLTKYKEDIAG